MKKSNALNPAPPDHIQKQHWRRNADRKRKSRMPSILHHLTISKNNIEHGERGWPLIFEVNHFHRVVQDFVHQQYGKENDKEVFLHMLHVCRTHVAHMQTHMQKKCHTNADICLAYVQHMSHFSRTCLFSLNISVAQ